MHLSTYEEILAVVEDLPSALTDEARDIYWLTPSNAVGLARDSMGRLETFLAGAPLRTKSRTVREAVIHHRWHRSSGASLDANQIVLPAVGHFDQVGAFLVTELLRNGAEEDLQGAFALTEPLIEFAINRLQISEAAMLGLAGELLVLDAMCSQASEGSLLEVVSGWDGWRRSARDMRWRGTGVEVKTTTRATSSHLIQGLHQIEPAGCEDGASAEDRLLLISVGLERASTPSDGFSIPMLVGRILERISNVGGGGSVTGFLDNVRAYGSESGLGYDHRAMADDALFANKFTVRFVRGYEMSDPRIQVIRRSDVSSRPHVDRESLRFRINLPEAVSLSNPVSGVDGIAQIILGQ